MEEKKKHESSKERKYINILLDLWEAIATYRSEVRKNFILGQIDPTNLAYYVSLLTSLWIELYPKLQDHSEINKEFNAYEPTYADPSLLLKDPEAVFKLELVLRKGLEILKVTEFEKVQ